MKWGDDEIDKLFRQRTEDLSFEYKKEYWKEFEAERLVADTLENTQLEPAHTIDALYKEKANSLSFEYNSAYWDEMAAMLPNNRKRLDFLWFFTSFVFVGLISSLFFINGPKTDEKDIIYSIEHSESTIRKNEHLSVIEESSIDQSNKKVEDELNLLSEQVTHNTVNEINSIENTTVSIDRTTIPAFSSNGTIVNVEDNSSHGNDNNTLVHAENEAEITDTEIILKGANTPAEQGIILVPKKMNVATIDRELAQSVLKNVKVPVKTNLYVELNGGLSQALTAPSESTTSSLGLGIGTSFQKGRFIFTSGVNAIISNHSDMVLSREAKVYGFGSELYRYNLEYKQTYSLEGAFNVGYIFGRHTISLGFRPSYMLNSRVIIEQQGPVGNDRNDVYGFMEGLNRFGFKPMLGYSVNLSHGLVLGINVGTQLVPTVNEEFVNGENSHFPIDGQLYLRKLIRFGK